MYFQATNYKGKNFLELDSEDDTTIALLLKGCKRDLFTGTSMKM